MLGVEATGQRIERLYLTYRIQQLPHEHVIQYNSTQLNTYHITSLNTHRENVTKSKSRK